MQRELLSIHIGQAGIQLGSSIWELLSREHKISSQEPFNQETFFAKSINDKYTSRALFLDLEPTVVDQVRKGPQKDLHRHLISGKQDAANNYARGRYTVGPQFIDPVIDTIRILAEDCKNLQGICIFNSIGGGTGSGFSSLLLQKLTQYYPKKTKIGFNIFPSPHLSTSCVESYNSLLAVPSLIENLDLSLVLDNESLYDLCTNKLQIEQPSYSNINSLISQVYSSLTTSLRFGGALNPNLNEFQTNLVPYSKLHFLHSSYAPLLNSQKIYEKGWSVENITNAVFQPDNMMIKSDTKKGKYIACCLNYRGQIISKEIYDTASALKDNRSIQFVNWCPNSLKIGMNNEPVIEYGQVKSLQTCSMIANNTSVIEPFQRIRSKFQIMYAKRAFVFWYVGEGMEEGQFWSAREKTLILEKQYEEAGK